MTTDEFIKKQEAKINDIIKNNKPLLFAVKSVMTLQHKRIFIEGKNVSGSAIGKYKDVEIYVSPKYSPKKFPTKGKFGDTKFENGKPHKTGYFENYLAFKKKIGRNQIVSTVDLNLTGDLKKNWANSKVPDQMQNATRIDAHHYNVNLDESNAVKVSKNGTDMNRYGNVFGLTKNEKEKFLKVITDELANALK